MESNDLFSHPYEPVAAPTTEESSDEVQAPTFSDLSQSHTPATRPASKRAD